MSCFFFKFWVLEVSKYSENKKQIQFYKISQSYWYIEISRKLYNLYNIGCQI